MDYTLTRGKSASETWLIGLLAMIAFFAPFGAGMETVSPYLSKMYLILIVLLIGCWIVFGHAKLLFPKMFSVFALFVFIHTVIVFGIFFPGELQFGILDKSVMENGYTTVIEGSFIAISRFFIFMLSGYAIAFYLRSVTGLKWISLAYNCGLFVTLLLGGYVFEDVGFYSEVRLGAGFMDPNSLGLTGLTAFFLALIFHSLIKRRLPLIRWLLPLPGLYAVLLSGSRSAFVGLVSGIIVLLLKSNLGKKKSYTISIGLLFTVFVYTAPTTYLEGLTQRFSIQRAVDDRGARRLDIWQEYLYAFPQYSVFGTGFSRTTGIHPDNRATHNNFFWVLVSFGLPGLIIFIQFLNKFRLIISKISDRYAKSILMAMFTAWVLNGMFLDTFCHRDTWIIFAILVAMPKIVFKEI